MFSTKDEVFRYEVTINGKEVEFSFTPSFKRYVKLPHLAEFYTNAKEYEYSDGKVYLPRNTKWFEIKDEMGNLHFLVLPGTKIIFSNSDDVPTKQLNYAFQDAKREYEAKKQRELRLYFYSNKKEMLKCCNIPDWMGLYEKLKYDISRNKVICYIDGEYQLPTEDCFVVGRVVKTIRRSTGGLADFVEPVYQISLDFKKSKNFQTYLEQIEAQSEVLLNLIHHTVKVDYRQTCRRANRAAEYIRKINSDPEISMDDANAEFSSKVWKNIEADNMGKLRHLHDVLCSEERFNEYYFDVLAIDPDEPVIYDPNDVLRIRFDNNVIVHKTASWIHDHIDHSMNVTSYYQGKLRNKYEFSKKI